MDIENNLLEKSCSNLTSLFSKYFDWNDIDLSITRVDLSNKQVSIMSNNYEWLLIYWNADLDLRLSERLSPGIQYWSNYSESFINTLAKTKKRKLKIDFCAKYGNMYDIVSINSRRIISLNDMISLYKCRPTIIDFAYESWKKGKDNYAILPLREEIKFPQNRVYKLSEQELEPLDIHPYMRFGNIRFTRKEIISIRLLLSHCRVKEISYIQGCSEATENKRIQRIKEKLGCSYTSPSGLFQALKENGITLACLESLASYP